MILVLNSMKAQNILLLEFEKRKKRNNNFSLRSFARYLGFSPAQLSQMMSGKRPITLNMAKKIIEKLDYSPHEKQQFLQVLIKDKKIEAYPEPPLKKQLEEDQFRIISDWYHLAILSLAKLKETKSDPQWIARKLGISVLNAHQALLRLVRLGLLKLSPKLTQVGEPFEVVTKIPSEAIRKYHKQNLYLAIEKIEEIPMNQREFQSISIVVHPNRLPHFKKLIDEFLNQAMAMAPTQPQHGSEVYHINVQMFPVTKIKRNDHEN